VLDDPTGSWWSSPPSFPDASGGLVSTIDDYWSFESMMLSGGTMRRQCVLSPESLALMTADRLSRTQREAAGPFLGEHMSWGLGMAVPATGSTAPLPVGFGWDGGSGTAWRSNSQSGVTGILFTQRGCLAGSPRWSRLAAVNAATIV
jgi:CubicO group peptidase (beta-lactamase class C family)